MTKKIDGYCQLHDNQDYLDIGNTVFVTRTPCTGKDPRCTVVVHKGKSERVFTESEVRAMLRDLIEDQARCDVHNGWQSGMIPDFAGIATKHGVSFDPV